MQNCVFFSLKLIYYGWIHSSMLFLLNKIIFIMLQLNSPLTSNIILRLSNNVHNYADKCNAIDKQIFNSIYFYKKS